MAGLLLLNKNNINYVVSNIVRRNISDSLEDYILFLIDNKVPVVTFGVLSRLGRATYPTKMWKISNSELTLFENKLANLRNKYLSAIQIQDWGVGHISKFIHHYNGNALSCGAGILEWNITEQGTITPC